MSSTTSRPVGGVPPGPVAARNREPVLDALRGLAVFGILLVNIGAFVDPGYLHQARETHGIDALVRDLTEFLVESKFTVLFGFLFGYGMAIQLDRPSPPADARGTRVARRLLLLFLIGAAHGVLLFAGDILMIYAIAGGLLYLMRGISPRRAVRLAIGILAAMAGLLLLAVLAGAGADSGREVTMADRVLANYRADFGTIVGQRIEDLGAVFATWWSLIPVVLAYFLLGLAAGKVGLLHRRAIPSRTLVRACLLGAAVGLPPAALYAFGPDRSGAWELAVQAIGYLTAPALALAYGAALLLFGRTTPGARMHAALAPAGRMALTNYLTQSLVCALVFTGYGLALAGRVGYALAVGMGLAVCLLQVLFSARWLRSHAFGPVEWLLRSFTYLRPQPWRAAQPMPKMSTVDISAVERGEYAVLAEGLHKRYGTTRALVGFELTVPHGTVCGLLGPNGAGKSTAIRILSTLLRPDEGRAVVGGFDMVRQAFHVRYRIGLTGQHAAVDDILTGRENLELFGRLYHLSAREARRRADELLERFDLTHAADKPPRKYSGGMRRRLDLAVSIIMAPPVLFLDEPTTGMDPRHRVEVWNAVRDLVARGTTVLLTTHYLDEADQLADSISVIDRGRVIARGTPTELKSALGGDQLDVVVSGEADLRPAADVLARVTGDTPEIRPETLRLSVPVRDRVAMLTEAVRAMDAAGLAARDVGIRQPTLDEVFVRLTGTNTRTEGRQR